MFDTPFIVLISLRIECPRYTLAVEVALLAASQSIALVIGELQAKRIFRLNRVVG